MPRLRENYICSSEDCQMQMVLLMTVDGFIIDKKVIGKIAEIDE